MRVRAMRCVVKIFLAKTRPKLVQSCVTVLDTRRAALDVGVSTVPAELTLLGGITFGKLAGAVRGARTGARRGWIGSFVIPTVAGVTTTCSRPAGPISLFTCDAVNAKAGPLVQDSCDGFRGDFDGERIGESDVDGNGNARDRIWKLMGDVAGDRDALSRSTEEALESRPVPGLFSMRPSIRVKTGEDRVKTLLSSDTLGWIRRSRLPFFRRGDVGEAVSAPRA